MSEKRCREKMSRRDVEKRCHGRDVRRRMSVMARMAERFGRSVIWNLDI
jgi:hypothetical protein